MKPKAPFTVEDAKRANEAWGANCGPCALAAVLGCNLNPKLIPGFEAKRYTNPSMMANALDAARVKWRYNRKPSGGDLKFPDYGLARVQWEGPWMLPGVPTGARYQYTHWVASCGEAWIFDINAIDEGGWISYQDWVNELVPLLIRECSQRGSGGWHLTHSIEVLP